MMTWHSIKRLIEKFHTWGISGAVNYLRGRLACDAHVKKLNRNALLYPQDPVPGVTVIGTLGGKDSYAKTLRDLVLMLKRAEIPFQTFDLASSVEGIEDDVRPLLTHTSDFRVLRFSIIIGGIPRGLLKTNTRIKKYRLVFWEFESGLLENEDGIRNAPGILAMSAFNANEFRKVLPFSVPVKEIVYPFRFIDCELMPKTQMRSRYGLSDKDFVVFYNFSISSSYYRKNPEAAIRAFSLAFKEIGNARLVFKVQGAAAHPDKMERMQSLAKELGVADKLVLVTKYLSTVELYSLTAASDVYISLHRGEGFGLGIAEAMSLGVPAVVTGYGAPTEFCTLENSMLVPYVMRDVRPEEVDLPCYRFVRQWADADVLEAAKSLRRLYEDPGLRGRLGQNARSMVAERFSVAEFRKSMFNGLMR